MEKTHHPSIRLLVALAIALMLLPILGAPNIASATGDHYVSIWGNDTGDGSQVNPWRNIQYAINQASTGDSIHVAEGTYAENVSFSTAVTLLGGYSADFAIRNSDVYITTVDGGGLGNVMYLGYPAQGTVIDGFKVTGGGGGIFIDESQHVTIAHNEICYNTGSGIFGSQFTIWISIEHNSVHHNTGNGISNWIMGGNISDNDIWANGGYGISGHIGGTIIGNTIHENGGGIYLVESGPTIEANSIIGNYGTGIGWGEDCTPQIVGCVISGNSGWGISPGGNIKNTVISRNSAGGIRVQRGARITNSTVSLNGGEGGIVSGGPYLPQCYILNSIVWGNTPQDLKDVNPPQYSGFDVRYSDIGIGAISGEGNIAADPLFINPMPDDYHLQGTSPCIDAGTNTGAPATDIEGIARPIDGNGDGVATVDMGAYEHPFTPPMWSVPMTAIAGSEGYNSNLEFGTKAGATDGFDNGVDLPHPPPGPGATFDAYFSISHLLFPHLDKDYRAPLVAATDTRVWTLKVNSQSQQITLTWDASQIPTNLYASIDTGAGTIDMKAQNNLSLAAGEHTLLITISYQVEFQLSLKAGWNMVSVPVIPADTSVSAVFPGVSAVFTWDAVGKTYIMPTSLETDTGYWVAVTQDGNITITGVPVTTWTSAVKAGWDMVGSVIGNASIANPNDNADGSVQPFAYAWDPVGRGYVYTTNINPGKGYWTASVQDCTLTVP